MNILSNCQYVASYIEFRKFIVNQPVTLNLLTVLDYIAHFSYMHEYSCVCFILSILLSANEVG